MSVFGIRWSRRVLWGFISVLPAVPAGAAEAVQDYPLRPAPWTAVTLDGSFWAPRLKVNRTVTVPHNLRETARQGSQGGFAVLAGRTDEKYHGYMWGDSDVYKTIEGAISCLRMQPDPQLERRLEDLIDTIVRAQAPDGYLMPHIQIAEPSYAHFTDETTRTCESYSMGHMIESAVAHYQATGRTNFLQAAVKCADLLARVHEAGSLEQISGHPEIELALVKLYRATGERKYLRLASSYVNNAAALSSNWSAGRPFLAHDEAAGHAVAACYLYCGATDVAVLTGDTALLARLERKWEDMAGRKMYVTGGIGLPAGEAFGAAYDLPNERAYCETCAALAAILWSHRMFLARGEARYLDVLERTLYNGFLSGVGLSGDRFFYPNRLAAPAGSRHQRAGWFGCPCCPANVVRLFPTLGGYMYALDDATVYVALYAAGTGHLDVGGVPVTITQETRYPWDGRVKLTVAPAREREFAVCLRIPAWCRSGTTPGGLYRANGASAPALSVSGDAVGAEPLATGFVRIHRRWKKGDRIELDLPMPVCRVYAHERVAANRGRVALARGPVVYCLEQVDHDIPLRHIIVPKDAPLAAYHFEELLGGVTVIAGTVAVRMADESEPRTADLLAVPYYAWAHRTPGAMTVWLPEDPALAAPIPRPTIASRARATASYCNASDTVSALNDQVEPPNSHDLSVPRHTFWNHLGTREWLQYDLAAPATVGAVEVYWFDDRAAGGCWVPESWRLLYREDGRWKPVTGASAYGTAPDAFNRVTFDPVRTDGLRIELTLQEGRSGGVMEWRVLGAP